MHKNVVNSIGVQAKLIVEEFNGFDRTKLSRAEIEFGRGIIDHCIFIVKCGVVRNGYDTPEYKRSMKHIGDLEYFRDNI
jgi:hypothetical protein